MSAVHPKPRETRLGGKAARRAVIETVWQQVTPELGAELMAFWASSGALSDPDRATARIDEAVCIVRDESGTLCGVCTVQLRVLPRLNQPMYYLRMFLGKTVRGMDQVIPLHNASRDALAAWNRTLVQPEALGVLIEFESRFLSARFKQAYIPEAASTFIGYSLRGLQLRVSFFDGAELLPPAAMPLAVVRH